MTVTDKAIENLRAEVSRLRGAVVAIESWDVGLLGDGGGGDVGWWHDYIRSIIGGIQQAAATALEDE